MKSKCPTCVFLFKKFGKRDLIFECKYWGLKSQRKLPDVVVMHSIGKECPFYKENKNKREDQTSDKSGSTGVLDIVI